MAMAGSFTTTLRDTLKTLCCRDGWSYAILWRFHPQSSLLLTMEDAHCEDQLGEEIVNMLPQVHSMGQGIVGQVALTGKYRWVHLDAQTEELMHICEDDSGLHQQFSSGIKTIVVISVKPWGVVQFGSQKKILETVEFLEQTQILLTGMEDEDILSALTNTVLSHCENYDLDGLLASISSEDWNLKSVHSDDPEVLLGNTYSSASPDDSFPSMYNIHEEGITPMHGYSSYLGDQLTLPIEAQDVADVHYKVADAFSYDQLAVQHSELTSLYSIMERLLDPTGTFQDQLGNSLDNQHSDQCNLVTEVNFPDSLSTVLGLPENLEPLDTLEEFSEFSMDDLCQFLAPSPDDSICGTVTALDNTLSQSQEFNPTSFELVGSRAFDNFPVTYPAMHNSITVTALDNTLSQSHEFDPASFDLVGSSAFDDFPVTYPAVHNSITDTLNLDAQQTSTVMHGSENSLLDSMGLDLSCDQADEWWGSMVTPLVSAAATDTTFSDCISELNVPTLGDSGKRLFSELRIEELLNGELSSNSLYSSNFRDHLSTSKQLSTEYSPVNRNSIHLVQPVSELGNTHNLVYKKEIFPRLQVGGLWIGDRPNNTMRVVPAQPQKPVEPNKVTRKKPKPGETTRPRPKDRQQIQDSIQVLRGIIPNCGKCSIDSLLDRTVRYMLFLISITEYADKLQEPHEPKHIRLANGDRDGLKGSGDVTWAFEVAGQTMVCPIIVEDMGPPGHMLIELLCEEQGSFFEIVDIIRGFGLNVLKGKMERRENKIWARFIVEANRHVTRIEVFWSLLHHLQQTNIQSGFS